MFRIVVAIIRLYIAWERSWVQYATTSQRKQKNQKNQNTKNQKTQNQKTKNTKPKNRKLWCRDLEHLYSIYTYIISGNRILSGGEQGSRGACRVPKVRWCSRLECQFSGNVTRLFLTTLSTLYTQDTRYFTQDRIYREGADSKVKFKLQILKL